MRLATGMAEVTRRPTPIRGGPASALPRRDALTLLLDALDAVLEEGVAPPDWRRPDASLRTCALELAFAEAHAVVGRLRASEGLPAPISSVDADRLVAAAASICVWARTRDGTHPMLELLSDAVARVPGSATPLAQLA